MRASYVNNLNYLRERAAEMRSSSKELKDNNTAAVIMRLADLYDRLADRAKTRGDRAMRSDRAQPKEYGLPTRSLGASLRVMTGYAMLSDRPQSPQPDALGLGVYLSDCARGRTVRL